MVGNCGTRCGRFGIGDEVSGHTSQSIQTKGSVERSSGIVDLWRTKAILGFEAVSDLRFNWGLAESLTWWRNPGWARTLRNADAGRKILLSMDV